MAILLEALTAVLMGMRTIDVLKGGGFMIPAWTGILIFIAGTCAGYLMLALFSANNDDRGKRK